MRVKATSGKLYAPWSAVGTLAQPDTPDHEQDADDLKRTQRLIQEQPS